MEYSTDKLKKDVLSRDETDKIIKELEESIAKSKNDLNKKSEEANLNNANCKYLEAINEFLVFLESEEQLDGK